MNLPGRKQAVEHYCQDVRWDADGEWAYILCPGWHLHQTPNGGRDARAYVAGKTVSIYCFHEHCEELRSAMQRAIRSVVLSLPGEEITEPTKAQKSEYVRIFHVARSIKQQLESIFRRYWHPEILSRRLDLAESRQRFFDLFTAKDCLWIGEVHHSGIPYGAGHFRTVNHWSTLKNYWPFTCTGIFRSDEVTRRAQKEVIRQDYRVIEFDSLDPDPVQNQLKSVCLIRFLEETCGIFCRLAIDAGHKSIHFWCENNPEVFDEGFWLFLKELGADTKCLRAYQPVRFPGVIRPDTGQAQCVIEL
jgi:hypothetical protein